VTKEIMRFGNTGKGKGYLVALDFYFFLDFMRKLQVREGIVMMGKEEVEEEGVMLGIYGCRRWTFYFILGR
jgi:hypothetical protein